MQAPHKQDDGNDLKGSVTFLTLVDGVRCVIELMAFSYYDSSKDSEI